jgi:very-short-patch-repair endonuclease
MPVVLTRSSVRAGVSGFKLASRDEDTRINPTLLEKLRRDLGIALDIPDAPPADGVDVERVLGLFRELAAKRKGWDVKEEMWLGEFSFKKFLMWRDLQEQEAALTAHPLVNQMLERPHTLLPSQGEFPDPRKLDASFAPEAVFTPLMADSSQLAAIQAASEGRSFVLEGPPGTGKSQTITNLIAHCIAHGKTVLFISEKKAALEVVRKRLAEINLSAFCLEVHSDKARRTEIIEQLKAPLRFSTSGIRRQWQETSGSLGTLRAKLNHYVEALHHRYPCGLSIYESIGHLCARPAAQFVPLGWGDPHTWNGAPLTEMRALVAEMPPLLLTLGPLKSHGLRESVLTESSPAIERTARERVRATRMAFLTLCRSVKRIAERLKIPATDLNAAEIDLIVELAGKLLLIGGLPQPITGVLGDPGTIERLQTAARVIQERQGISRELRSQFDQTFLSADMDEMEALHEGSLHSWWPKSLFQRRRLRSILRGHTQGDEALERGLSQLPEAMAKVRRLRALDGQIKSLDALNSCLGESWEGARSDVKRLLECLQWLESVTGILRTLSRGDAPRMARLIDGARELAATGYEDLRDSGSLAAELRSLAPARDAFRNAMTGVAATLQLERVSIDPNAPEYLQGIRKWVVEIQRALAADQLRYWAAWQRVRGRACAMGLGAIVEYCAECAAPGPEAANIASIAGGGGPRSADLSEVFEASIHQWVLEEGLARSAPLKNFIGRSQDQQIVEFRKLDAEYVSLASAAAAARVEARIPRDGQDAVPAEELALLRKEFGKKSRHRPLRQLFSGMPGLMSRLKPCLLMSPLSVAQHLATDFPPFDLVIFDEASQIPVWDAIGAIARARQTIVVGDPKQMPPTAFFARDDDEDAVDGPDATVDLESILDETMTTLPIQRLEWHYRSRFESLITFSNRRYYDGRLVTFPSPVAADRAVQLHRVNGVYDRGASRTNRAEAEAVVAFVIAHLRAAAERGGSIGVVTFNAQQQLLIDDLFDDARREDPALEKHFAPQDGREEVFVKNLENVQGDERDVIVFSTTFGVDAAGRMSLNFGPINSANGPRRLNVAITRSRLAMHVFTSIPNERLDTTRTTSIGVRHLKEFIDFAERGVDALREAGADGNEGAGSPFEDAVASALRGKGWEVHQQIGCGGYRIDMGVVDPDAPGTYLVGVECDGPGYHRSATARDRDRLRPHKLEELGWTLYRLWSTEYWHAPQAEIDKLHQSLGALAIAAKT